MSFLSHDLSVGLVQNSTQCTLQLTVSSTIMMHFCISHVQALRHVCEVFYMCSMHPSRGHLAHDMPTFPGFGTFLIGYKTGRGAFVSSTAVAV